LWTGLREFRLRSEGESVSVSVLRTADGWYVERGSDAFAVRGEFATTAALLTTGLNAVRTATEDTAVGSPADQLIPLSPVTVPCRVVGQAVNYRSHARESRVRRGGPVVFFRKSSSSISGPTADVVWPSHVRLLDYEVELGLVIGRPLDIGTAVTPDDLPTYVAGWVVSNDISARDVQLEKGQFYEGKSYPTFTPTGPRLVLVSPSDFGLLPRLRLRLWVNGQLRQDQAADDMITEPAAALTMLARFQRLDPGDLFLTGTPGGTALRAPPVVVEKIGGLLPTPLKWRLFFRRQARKPDYLRAGDVVTASIATDDGKLDLGTQRTVVRRSVQA
jgi:2-keto-4-pentenoate hydratase/2-oxohepta-3-ene-1,7-dioic acid hydratase in catechol pathway